MTPLRLVPPVGFVSLSLEQRAAFSQLQAAVGAMSRTFAGSATTPAKAASLADDCLAVANLALTLHGITKWPTVSA